MHTLVGIITLAFLVGALLVMRGCHRRAKLAEAHALAADTVAAAGELIAAEQSARQCQLSHIFDLPGEMREHVADLFSDDRKFDDGRNFRMFQGDGTYLRSARLQAGNNGVAHNGHSFAPPSMPDGYLRDYKSPGINGQ